MPLSDGEKQKARYHLGYPALTTAASIALGVPTLTQTNFLVESALDRLLEPSLEQVRRIITIMDGIEGHLVDAQERLAAIQLEELHLREDEPDKLEAEYRRWGHRLADIVGAPINPFSLRYKGGAGAVNSVPIIRG